jgi:RNA polymerase sigma factor (sigma-70 family)
LSQPEQLVQENAAWARKIGFNEAKKLTRFPGASLWFDDVVGGALEGLWQAAQSWDGRETFQGWAFIRVQGGARDAWRRLSSCRAADDYKPSVCYLDDLVAGSLRKHQAKNPSEIWYVGHPEASFATPFDEIADTQETLLKEVISQLPTKEAECLTLALEGYQYWEIATMWHRTEARVTQVMRLALNDARLLLGKPPIPKRVGNYSYSKKVGGSRKGISNGSGQPPKPRQGTRAYSYPS